MKTSASLSVRSLMLLIVLLLSTPSAWAIGGQGTQDNPYKLYDVYDLRQFRDIVNGSNGQTQNTGAWAELHDNIDNLGPWIPIGTSSKPFTGTFDGRGHSISGMSIKDYKTSHQGLFGCINNATVKHFNLSGSMTSATTLGNNGGTVMGSGTVVGFADGSSLVEDISSSVDWTIEVVTQTHLGGIVGNISGTTCVRGCTYTGTMNAGKSTDSMGGIVGYARPSCATSIINCFFSGKITTSPAADVSPVMGGILGYISDGSGVFGGIRGCYSCGTLDRAGSGKTTYVSGIIGQAKSKSIHDNNVKNNYYLYNTALRAIEASESTSSFDATTNKAITISVKTNRESYGSVGHCYVNPTDSTITQLEVYAYPSSSGHAFIRWSDGGEQTHHVALSGNIDLTATFQPKETKAVLADSTLTFYFDAVDHPGTTFALPDANSTSNPSWYNSRMSIANVVFDSSFSDYRPVNCCRWFYACSNLATITDISNLNTSEVTNMSQMFSYCKRLTSIDVSSFNTSKVTTMTWMFGACNGLTSIDLTNFDTSNVTNISYMFTECSSLTTVNVSSFNTSKVTNMVGLFSYCGSLDSINVTNFNTAEVTTMGSMFNGCKSLTSLDLSSFETSNVKQFNSMFDECSQMTSLTIGKFDMQKQQEITGGLLFYENDKLDTLTLRSIPFLLDGSFNRQFNGEGKVVNCILDANSTRYTGTNYLPNITYCNHYSSYDWGSTRQPTCTEPGGTIKHCRVCGADYCTGDIPALGHDYTSAWSWSEDASYAKLTFTCSRDDSHQVMLDTLSVPKVVITSQVIPATCTTQGVATYNASVTYDDQPYSDEHKVFTDLSGHTLDDDSICTTCGMLQTLSSDGYYQLYTANQLLWYLNQVNTNNEITINGRLMKDIVINDGTFDAQGTYTPGTSDKPLVDGFMTGHKLYNATFDGNNHAIVGLYGSVSGNCGLFAQIVNSTVKDLTLRNCYLKSTGNNVGAIGGYANSSNITNCYATDCYIVGNNQVGGIVGSFDGEGRTLTHCGSNSTVSGNNNVGGVCGDTDIGVTISYCYATGAVSGDKNVGGVCGSTYIGVTISYCYATGAVSGDNNVGGVCGGLNWDDDNHPDILCHLTSCYFTGQVSEGGKGICYNPVNDNQVTLCYTTVKNAGADSKSRCVEGGVALDRFKSGEIAWLLNGTMTKTGEQDVFGDDIYQWSPGPTTGTQPWRQNLPSPTSEQTADTTPVLDTTHATVYVSTPCQTSYSNSPDVTLDHTPDDDGNCTKCHQPDTPVLSSDGYYQIYTPYQLLWYLNKLDTNGEITINGRLMKDIVINDGTFDAQGSYTPGTSNKPLVDGFMTGHMLKNATFDGNHHAIVGLYGSVSGNCGLFAQIFYSTVKDLTLRNCYLKSTGDNVGAICGYANGSNITNCFATDCYIVGYDNVGGIVGCFDGEDKKITHCGSNSTVSGNNNVGGVCGGTDSVVIISYCYATGAVSGNSSVGGVCGYLYWTSESPYILCKLTSCYFTGQVSEGGKGICGNPSNDNQVTLCYTTVASAGADNQDRCVEGNVTLDRFKSGEIAWLLNGSVSIVSFDYDDVAQRINATFSEWSPGPTTGTQPWRQNLPSATSGQTADTTPVLDTTHATVYASTPCQTSFSNSPDVTLDHTPDDDGNCTKCHQPDTPVLSSDGYYQIYTPYHLLWYLNQVNAYDEITINGRMMADIVINDGTFDAQGHYTPGTSGKPLVDGFMTGHKLFQATFDGNNHAIVGLYGSVSGNCGLFAQIVNSTVKDLTLRNCYLKSTGDKVGAIGGYTNGSNITNCYATDCYIVGNDKVGGIVGLFDGRTLTHCGSNSTVSGNDTVGGVCGGTGIGVTISYCYATGTVSGNSSVGGVCGGIVYGGTISYCYATGAVSGNNSVGGVCGYLNWENDDYPDILCQLTSCYFTGQVSEGGKGICSSTNNNLVTLCYTTVAADEDDEPYSADRFVEGGVALDRFKSGEIAWLLNGTMTKTREQDEDGNDIYQWSPGPTTGTQPWRQNLPSATSGQTADTTPVLDTTHATVYASMPCQISYSNSPDVIIDHTPDANGICTKCHQPDTPVLSSDGYYQIYTPYQLMWYLNQVNAYDEITINGRLMKDIVINDGTFDAQGHYTPGTSNKPLVDGFMTGNKLKNATFDGNNHAIVGLYGCNNNRCALFSQIDNATVKNLTLRNCYLKSSGSDVGAIAGRVDKSEINNCYATDCYLEGCHCVGGIVGVMYGKGNTLTHCGSNSTVIGSGWYAGGVCGFADFGPTISYCYATGAVIGNICVGGVCGNAKISNETIEGNGDDDSQQIVYSVTISYCYSTSEVRGISAVGGICGQVEDDSNIQDQYDILIVYPSTLTSCYFTGQVSEGGNGICPNLPDNNIITLCYTTVEADANDGLYSAARCVEGGVALDRFKSGEIAWLLNGTIENGEWKAGPTTGTQPWRQNLPSATSGQTADTTPVLDTTHATVYVSMPCQTSYSNSPDVTIDHTPDADGICTKCHQVVPIAITPASDGYYQINNHGELLWYLNQVNASNEITINGRLMKDIVINDGTFDAQGNYTPGTSGKPLVDGFMTGRWLNNATFDGNNHAIVGLYVSGSDDCGLFSIIDCSTVKDLTLRNCYLKGTGDGVGAIGGLSYGSNITNCYATDCYIVGNGNVGGIIGFASEVGMKGNTITHCGSNSTVSGSDRYVGGVCGMAGNSTTISYCYSTGAVSGSNFVGGVCGIMVESEDKPCKLTNCYFTGQMSGSGNGIYGGLLAHNLVTLCYTTVEAEEEYAQLYSADRCVEGGVSLDRFKSGEIAWLLNGTIENGEWTPGSTTGTQPWRQAIGIDDTPRLVGPMLYQETTTETAGSAPTYYNYVDQNRDHKLTIGDVTQLIYRINNGSADSNMDVDGKLDVVGKPYVDQGDVEALVRIAVGK